MSAVLASKALGLATRDGLAISVEASFRNIALAIAGELRGQLLGADRDAVVKRHTENREAYGLYLKGRYHWNRRYKGGLQKGMEFFQQSLQLDPEFALPHCGLADSFAILGFYNIQPPA